MTAKLTRNDIGFRLPNGRTASYEWGSHAIRLSDSLATDKNTISLMLAAISNGRAFWKNGREFRRSVGILHEATHCLQDLTTGIGLWDYFLRKERFPSILRDMRIASWSTRLGDRFEQEESGAYGRWLDDGFLPQSQEARSSRLHHLAQRAGADPHIDLHGTDLETLAIERLLEADAVVQVYLALTTLVMSSHERALMHRNRALWAVSDMPESYQGVYHDVFDVVRRWKEADGGLPDRNTTAIALLISAFLIDLSLAYPSRQFMRAHAMNPQDYDPGLKFAMLLSALFRLKLDRHKSFIRALSAWDVDMAESILLEHSSIAYLPTSAIYKDWMIRLQRALRTREDAIGRLRLRALQHRLDTPAAYVFKSLETFFTRPTPLIIVDRQGYRSTNMDPHYLDPVAMFELIGSIQHDVSIRRIMYSAYEAIPFVCCHAEFNTCTGKADTCMKGIMRSDEFPSETRCTVRVWLNNSSFGFFKTPPMS